MPKSIRGVLDEFKHRALRSGSSTGKVVTNPKQAIAIAISEQKQRGTSLHPHLARRAEATKHAHAHLSKTVPGFRGLPGHEQLRRTAAHVTKTGY